MEHFVVHRLVRSHHHGGTIMSVLWGRPRCRGDKIYTFSYWECETDPRHHRLARMFCSVDSPFPCLVNIKRSCRPGSTALDLYSPLTAIFTSTENGRRTFFSTKLLGDGVCYHDWHERTSCLFLEYTDLSPGEEDGLVPREWVASTRRFGGDGQARLCERPEGTINPRIVVVLVVVVVGYGQARGFPVVSDAPLLVPQVRCTETSGSSGGLPSGSSVLRAR